MREWITGRHPVVEVLKARRRDVFGLRVAEGIKAKDTVNHILKLAKEHHVPIETVKREKLNKLGEQHQGVALEVSGYPYVDISDIELRWQERKEDPFILILDLLQNPQNLGTLLRTAESVGVHGVVMAYNRAAMVTPAVVNASSGATEHLLVTQMNISQMIKRLQEKNIWVIGLDGGAASQPVEKTRLDGGLAVVVGSEGDGLRDLVRKSCDVLVKLPMLGHVESLNASIAGSVTLYQALFARRK
ncbi:MAG: 23S rRNA (guanosine(2251)-2'-O)-methyltransferase RlmB [Anaerolineaceae bacterium]|nr:23S rRNA (guanosine(2251)-2'-O)-methyltransferase RlmB [Anaerolineaceae bacterium]